MTARRSIIHVVACCLALLGGCGELPGKPHEADRPVPADQITDFATLYGTYCAGCHGADGRLGPAPPLNDAIFLAIVPDADLLRLVDAGRPGTSMPGFSQQHGGPLTKAQVRAVAEGIKPHWVTIHSVGSDAASSFPTYAFVPPADEAAAAEAASRGEKLFAQDCAGCHGAEGAGGDVGRLNDPDFLTLVSNQTLRRIIITGRPDLGMPHFAAGAGRTHDFKPLTSAEIDDLVALLSQWREAGPRREARGQRNMGQKLSAEERR